MGTLKNRERIVVSGLQTLIVNMLSGFMQEFGKKNVVLDWFTFHMILQLHTISGMKPSY